MHNVWYCDIDIAHRMLDAETIVGQLPCAKTKALSLMVAQDLSGCFKGERCSTRIKIAGELQYTSPVERLPR